MSRPAAPENPEVPENSGAVTASDPSAEKPVEEWATGDEPATGAQLSYLATLAREAGEEVPDNLTKGQASTLIDRLRERSPRVATGD